MCIRDRNRTFKANTEMMQFQGTQPQTLITLLGNCEISCVQLVLVPIKIVLLPTFPYTAPYVTILTPNDPSRQLQPQDYLVGNEVKIPYLITWNMSSIPQPTLAMMWKYLKSTLMAKSPYVVNAPQGFYSGVQRPPVPQYQERSYSGYQQPTNTYNMGPQIIQKDEKQEAIQEINKHIKALHSSFQKDAQKAVNNLQRVEVEIVKNERILEDTKKKLVEKRQEVWKRTDEMTRETNQIREDITKSESCLLYTSPSPRDLSTSRMPSSA
eukprot:TRINITY_DN230_c0_g1_i7.p1 TRINITY_DN230_c0_g1~~TRINITY_DN230_c0_g1_i7.p1  ORF type:complete len:268 (-),score=81.69 TRINITY_DN230_c0_g1_i7:16-819(-)